LARRGATGFPIPYFFNYSLTNVLIVPDDMDRSGAEQAFFTFNGGSQRSAVLQANFATTLVEHMWLRRL